MYAIFRDGGHQYKAEVGKEMYVDVRGIEPGVDLVFDEVLDIVHGDQLCHAHVPCQDCFRVGIINSSGRLSDSVS